MSAPKNPKARLEEALRANLRRRKAQMQAREDHAVGDGTSGVVYSGYIVRDKPQAETD